MIIKIILIIVLVLSLYIAFLFVSPATVSQIDDIIWIPGLSERIKWGKESFDAIVTDIPSIGEVQSGALDAKKKFLDGVDSTKETIDSVRGGAQKVESTYNEAKESFDQAKETFDTVKGTIDDLWEKIEQVQVITGGE